MPVLTLRAYGRTVGIDAPDEALHIARDRLPHNFRVGQSVPDRRFSLQPGLGQFRVSAEGEELGIFATLEQAAEWLLSHVELWVAEHAVARVFVHAGCAVVANRAIVLPGRSMTGKSSLTLA